MDIEDARIRCQGYAESGMLRPYARNALRRDGFDEQTIEEVLADYEQMQELHRRRKRRFTRVWGALLFLSCTGLFLYWACFASSNWYVIVPGLLGPAMFGLLKMLLP